MRNVSYTGATVNFPEQFGDGKLLRQAPDPRQIGKDYTLEELRGEKGKIVGDVLLFDMDGYIVEAVLSGCNIPSKLLENSCVETAVNKDIVMPLKEVIINDIKPAEEKIKELREKYVLSGKHQTNLYFNKHYDSYNPEKTEFRLLEYFSWGNEFPMKESPFNKVANLYALFESLPEDKGIPVAMIKDDFKDSMKDWNLWGSGERVVLEENKVPYIKRESLEKAIEQALIIYDQEEMLKKLDFENILSPQRYF